MSRPGTYLAARVIGVLALLAGVIFTGLGVLQASEGGYFTVPSADISTSARALMTREIEVGERGGYATDPSGDVGELARVRIRATSHKPVFVGIARVSDLQHYLRDASYDEMRSYTTDPLHINFDRHEGTTAPEDPANQHFWVAKASGRNIDLQWDKTSGPWAVVAMNTDRSPGVSVTADVGLRFGFLLPIGLAALGFGILLIMLPRIIRHMKRTTPANRITT